MDFKSKLKEKYDKLSKLASNIDSLPKLKVPAEIQQERYNICLACDKLYKPTNTCKICGCFMNIKTWMPTQNCPVFKWDKYKVPESDSETKE